MNTRHGFTLVELLAAIVVIAVLAGLIAPAVNRSRQMARTTACLCNFRQIGMALQVYVNENEGLMPSLQNRDSPAVGVATIDTVLLPKEGGRVFQCPADRSSVFASSGTSCCWNFTVDGQDVDKLFSVAGGTIRRGSR
jgi:prepilin-type N-terminal cleavage/methylation domain-containing protein